MKKQSLKRLHHRTTDLLFGEAEPEIGTVEALRTDLQQIADTAQGHLVAAHQLSRRWQARLGDQRGGITAQLTDQLAEAVERIDSDEAVVALALPDPERIS